MEYEEGDELLLSSTRQTGRDTAFDEDAEPAKELDPQRRRHRHGARVHMFERAVGQVSRQTGRSASVSPARGAPAFWNVSGEGNGPTRDVSCCATASATSLIARAHTIASSVPVSTRLAELEFDDTTIGRVLKSCARHRHADARRQAGVLDEAYGA
jgi:hypothetical protein